MRHTVVLLCLCAVVVALSVAPAAAQSAFVPFHKDYTDLSVHPNERAPGLGASPKLGTAPWTSSGIGGAFYEWKTYTFWTNGGAEWGDDQYCVLIKVCAQNFNHLQNASGQDDKLWLKVDGATPTAPEGIQTGPAGSYQWKGDSEHGNRKTLWFAYGGPPDPDGGLARGEHTLKFTAKNTPIIWWVEVEEHHCSEIEVAGPPPL